MRRTIASFALYLTLAVPGPLDAQLAQPVSFSKAQSELKGAVWAVTKPPSRVRYAVVGAAAGIAATIVLMAKFGGEAGPGSVFAVIPVVIGAGVLGAVTGLIVHAARH